MLNHAGNDNKILSLFPGITVASTVHPVYHLLCHPLLLSRIVAQRRKQTCEYSTDIFESCPLSFLLIRSLFRSCLVSAFAVISADPRTASIGSGLNTEGFLQF